MCLFNLPLKPMFTSSYKTNETGTGSKLFRLPKAKLLTASRDCTELSSRMAGQLQRRCSCFPTHVQAIAEA